MIKPLATYFIEASEHKIAHQCGGVPYGNGDMLQLLTTLTQPKKILELGTGTGYSTACFVLAQNNVLIDTIDQDQEHIDIAKRHWLELGVAKSITTYCDKAEAILPELDGIYDIIFFDGYDPSLKFLLHFEKLLRKGGLLISANLFLKDAQGGRYVRHLMEEKKWITGVFEDTAISVKRF